MRGATSVSTNRITPSRVAVTSWGSSSATPAIGYSCYDPSQNLPCQMRSQRVVGRLTEERRFFRGGLQQLLILIVDIVAELDSLIFGHPGGKVDPGDWNLLRQGDIGLAAGCDLGVDRG